MLFPQVRPGDQGPGQFRGRRHHRIPRPLRQTHFPLTNSRARTSSLSPRIGLAPIRSVIWNCLDLRKQFGKITIVYGARTVADLVYKRELPEWAKYPDTTVVQAVDPGGETKDWTARSGWCR